MGEDIFGGLESGVLEVPIPQGCNAEDYLKGFKIGITMGRDYIIKNTLPDSENKNLYHLYFSKTGDI